AILDRRGRRRFLANLSRCALAERHSRDAVSGNRGSITHAGIVRVDLEDIGAEVGAERLRAAPEFDRWACFRLTISKLATHRLAPLSMTTPRAVLFFVLALTAIRLSMLATTDLEFDEAHYWMWSERLAPAYFSKGPCVSCAMRASTAVFGANEFGVRFFSPVLGAATSLLLFYFARRLFSATAGFWAVIALNVTPIFTLGA